MAAGTVTFTAARSRVVTVAEPFAAISARSSTPAKPPRRLIVSGKAADDAAVAVEEAEADAEGAVAEGDAGPDGAEGDAGPAVAGDDGVESGLSAPHPVRPASSRVARTIDVYDFGNGFPLFADGIGNGNCPRIGSFHPWQPQAQHSCGGDSSPQVCRRPAGRADPRRSP
ncbi:hypothetical protein Axi01nite_33420 [Actinoplanes xinjiangensis]|nr:hypothetical protein Axi01nite_33420 [Actinoplanes xinjiangensis]